jgi:hypothetical protein
MDEKRRRKASAKLCGFRDAVGGRLTREEVASTHGIMQRVALVFPLGRCWLFSIRRLLAAATLHPWVRMGADVVEDMQVYIATSILLATTSVVPALLRNSCVTASKSSRVNLKCRHASTP